MAWFAIQKYLKQFKILILHKTIKVDTKQYRMYKLLHANEYSHLFNEKTPKSFGKPLYMFKTQCGKSCMFNFF